jgi:hypothetical protein
MFRRCQRQWYFKHCLANANAKKNPDRRNAYLLSKLQSISAWRGQIVDSVISNQLVPALNRGRSTTLHQLKNEARRLFEAQLQCAREHRLRQPQCSPSAAGDSFAAFHCMEYGGTIPEEEIERAWTEIELALGNLFALSALRESLKQAQYLVAQRALSFPHSDVTVRAVPDLIAFGEELPPTIIDWKVHAFGLQEAWLQLGTYALALSEGANHRDFPAGFHTRPQDVRLLEVQLLNGVVREYQIDDDQLDDIHAYIAASVDEIMTAMDGRDNSQLHAEDFSVTFNPDQCIRCSFRSMCWEKPL